MSQRSDHRNAAGLPEPQVLDKLMETLAALDLHGIVLVGYSCPVCGMVHNFSVGSDLTDEEDVAEVLTRYGRICASHPATHTRAMPGPN